MLQFLAFLWLSSSAFAAPLACHGFADLPFSVETCDDNVPMGHDALACVRSYRDRVQKAQADVLAKFQVEIQRMKDQQSDSFDRTQAGYQAARKRLDALISEGKKARADVDDLLDNLYYPPDYDEPDVTGMSTTAYLASEKCFSVPERVLHQSQAMIDKMMNDLKATEQAMLSHQNGAADRSADVQVMSNGASSVKTTSGAGAGKVSGTSSTPESDITGTKPPGSDDLHP